jgi:hypothetical protein
VGSMLLPVEAVVGQSILNGIPVQLKRAAQ